MPMPDGRIGHAEMILGDNVLMLATAWEEAGQLSPLDLGGVHSVPLLLRGRRRRALPHGASGRGHHRRGARGPVPRRAKLSGDGSRGTPLHLRDAGEGGAALIAADVDGVLAALADPTRRGVVDSAAAPPAGRGGARRRSRRQPSGAEPPSSRSANAGTHRGRAGRERFPAAHLPASRRAVRGAPGLAPSGGRFLGRAARVVPRACRAQEERRSELKSRDSITVTTLVAVDPGEAFRFSPTTSTSGGSAARSIVRKFPARARFASSPKSAAAWSRSIKAENLSRSAASSSGSRGIAWSSTGGPGTSSRTRKRWSRCASNRRAKALASRSSIAGGIRFPRDIRRATDGAARLSPR